MPPFSIAALVLTVTAERRSHTSSSDPNSNNRSSNDTHLPSVLLQLLLLQLLLLLHFLALYLQTNSATVMPFVCGCVFVNPCQWRRMKGCVSERKNERAPIAATQMMLSVSRPSQARVCSCCERAARICRSTVRQSNGVPLLVGCSEREFFSRILLLLFASWCSVCTAFVCYESQAAEVLERMSHAFKARSSPSLLLRLQLCC